MIKYAILFVFISAGLHSCYPPVKEVRIDRGDFFLEIKLSKDCKSGDGSFLKKNYRSYCSDVTKLIKHLVHQEFAIEFEEKTGFAFRSSLKFEVEEEGFRNPYKFDIVLDNKANNTNRLNNIRTIIDYLETHYKFQLEYVSKEFTFYKLNISDINQYNATWKYRSEPNTGDKTSTVTRSDISRSIIEKYNIVVDINSPNSSQQTAEFVLPGRFEDLDAALQKIGLQLEKRTFIHPFPKIRYL